MQLFRRHRTTAFTALRRAAGRFGLVLVFAMLLQGAAQAGTTYVFGVVPQFEARRMFHIWQPILDELEKRTGAHFTLAVAPSVAGFERQLARGRYDFVYGNPYHVLRANAKQGYLPLVRDRVPLAGIVVVRKDSPITRVQELEGKTLAVPSANALAASLMARAEMGERLGIHVRMVDVRTHTSAYLNAVDGITDAAGGADKTLAEQEPAVREALRVIHRTGDIPSHPIAAHPRVDAQVRRQVQEALLAMAREPATKALLDEIPMTEPVATSIDDYSVMRHWHLDRYWIDQGE